MAKMEDLGCKHLVLPLYYLTWSGWTSSSLAIRNENPTFNTETRETDPDWPDIRDDQSSLDASFYTPAETLHFRDFMKNAFHLPEGRIEAWMEETRNGNDEPLKGILAASLPRLRALTFIQ